MSRTRSSDLRVYQAYIITDTPGSTTRCTGAYYGTTSTITDQVTPRFSKRIRSGDVILNPVTISRVTGTCAVSTIQFGPHCAWGTRQITADFAAHCRRPFPVGMFDGDTAYMKDDTLIRAYAKVDESSIMGLVNLKELDQTVGMLRRPLSSAWKLLGRMIKTKKRKLGKSTRAAARAAADTWLEYRYGWMPLILDTKSIMKAADKIKQPPPRFLISRAGAKTPQRIVSERRFATNLPGMDRVDYTLVSAIETRVSSGVIYRYHDDSTSSRISRMLGVRLQDVPTALWEIIPYSFVVDWFIGVGDWIQAVTPKPNVAFIGNWTTVVDKRRQDVRNIDCSLYISTIGACPAQTYHTYPADGTGIYDTYSREVNRTLPTLPQWKGIALSTLHSVDAVSLLAQRLISGFGSFKH